VLWRCWLGSRKGIWPVKNWVVGCWHSCLGWGAHLHIAQQMPLPLTISCSSKFRLVLTFLVLPFWYLLTRVVLDIFHKSSKMAVCCVCVCVFYYLRGKKIIIFKSSADIAKTEVVNFWEVVLVTWHIVDRSIDRSINQSMMAAGCQHVPHGMLLVVVVPKDMCPILEASAPGTVLGETWERSSSSNSWCAW